jgi:TPP-dependent pyruvate/acetoin dehydrogenase alpha subunit
MVSRLSKKLLHDFYSYMVLTRKLEARISALGKEGKTVGGFFSSLGQEAISVGTTLALAPQDLVAPMVRNIGTVLVRGFTPADLLAQFTARGNSPGRGKDSNLHFSDIEGRGIIGCISHLGTLVPIMTGAALAGRMLGKKIVTMTYLGDGGCSVGDFHEGLNLAAVLEVPFVLIVENNGWAYSTPADRQMKIRDIVDRAAGYGIAGHVGDGNDVREVYRIARRAIEDARAGGGPQLVELKTFRRKGHAEHDDAHYVPPAQREEWLRKDPIERLEADLRQSGQLTDAERDAIHARIDRELAEAERSALAAPPPDPAIAREGVYADDAIVRFTPWWARDD